MIAVIFESWPMPGKMQTYLDMGTALRSHLETLDGFISIERFQSVTEPDKLVALSFWRDEAAVDAWRNHEISPCRSSREPSRRVWRLSSPGGYRGSGLQHAGSGSGAG